MKLLYFIAPAQNALVATVTYNWDITWVNANPDGALERPVIGILFRCLFYDTLLILNRDQWLVPIPNY
jgi:hypothetical protein